MKFPHIRTLGPESGWYRVGPLARVQIADRLTTPQAEAERVKFVAANGDKPAHGALLTHWARMIEMLHAAELARDLLDDPDITGTDLMADKRPRREEGIGVIEAPRGTLIHHYRVGENDLITYCNLIVSTTNNNQAMNEAVRAVADSEFNGREITEGLLNTIEVAIRAYDPCLSCATHALGAMPLEVTALDASAAADRPAPARLMRLVVFGWGNEARGDDALGPLLLRRIAAMRAPDVETIEDYQLQIEHALDLERLRRRIVRRRRPRRARALRVPRNPRRRRRHAFDPCAVA